MVPKAETIAAIMKNHVANMEGTERVDLIEYILTGLVDGYVVEALLKHLDEA